MSLRKYIFYYPLTNMEKRWRAFALRMHASGRAFSKIKLAVLTPADLMDISASNWNRNTVQQYGSGKWILQGLSIYEKKILTDFNIHRGKVLVIGSGGGRETLVLAKMGFDVEGIEVSDKCNRIADEYAAQANVCIKHITADLYKYDYPKDHYDFIHFSCRLYGCIPTKKRRVAFLERLKSALKSDGIMDISFFYTQNKYQFSYLHLLKKIVAFITFGNREIETGDLWVDFDSFNHQFDREQIESEIKEAGLRILDFQSLQDIETVRNVTYAVLKP